MKKQLFLGLILIGSSAIAQNVNIPDANFKAILVANSNINTNMDTEIQLSEAQLFNGSINCNNQNISSFEGIQSFISLQFFQCAYNQATSLDLSSNTQLTEVHCSNNQLSNLILGSNSALTYLNCSNNLLTILNLNQTPNLTDLNCGFNQLTALDLTQNTSLINLVCSNNSLSSLTVSQLSTLSILDFDNNMISSIDVSQNSALTQIEFANNSLTTLDLSQNGSLFWLYCPNNALENLNIANGNNTNFLGIYATGNNLSCVQVDDAAYSTTNWIAPNYNFDAGVSFNGNCSGTNGLFETEKTELSIYPNPVSESIHIQMTEPSEVTLMDINGKELFKSTISSTYQMNVSQLSNGVYFIRTSNGQTVKFIKE